MHPHFPELIAAFMEVAWRSPMHTIVSLPSYDLFFYLVFINYMRIYSYCPSFFSWSALWERLELRILTSSVTKSHVSAYIPTARPFFLSPNQQPLQEPSQTCRNQICQHLRTKQNADISTLWRRKRARTTKGCWGFLRNVLRDARPHERWKESINSDRCAS
jgi:hypothetical protein